MSLAAREFSADELALDKIYAKIPDNYYSSPLQTAKTKQIYGEFLLPPNLEQRPLLFGSFVSSIDGTIAFKDNPSSTLLARKNKFDPAGAQADFWLLNFLRANCDGVILGPGTLQAEPNLTGHIYDRELAKARPKLLAKPKVPLNIVVSRSGRSIPTEHLLFSTSEVPVLIATSLQGANYLDQNLTGEAVRFDLTEEDDLNLIEQIKDSLEADKTVILAAGEKNSINDRLLLKFFKDYQLDKILVETPSYAHYLMREGLLDELFLNQSGVYSGGSKYLNNNPKAAFSSDQPPQAQMLTIHTHSASFFYYRYQLSYQ